MVAPPKASKEVQVGPDDFDAPPKLPSTKETESQAPVKVAPASHTPRSRNATHASSPSIPKLKRVVHTPSENRLSELPRAPQTQRVCNAPQPGPAEECMTYRLPASQSTMPSASADATGKSQGTAKTKSIPWITA